MAIDINNTRYLIHKRYSGYEFGKVGIIGKQGLYVPTKIIPQLFSKYGYEFDPKTENFYNSFFQSNSEIIFKNLGIKDFEYIDFSDYEGATVLHDMNKRIPSGLESRYDTLIDIGSLEPMFNIPVALENYMKMVKTGGSLFLLNMPANNFCGHGFYQFSPELFFMLFSDENGFNLRSVHLVVDQPFQEFYKVKPTQSVKGRTELINDKPILLFGHFEKMSDVIEDLKFPVQYNYQVAWSDKENKSSQDNMFDGLSGKLRKLMTTISITEYFKFSIKRAEKRKKSTLSLYNSKYFSIDRDIQ